MQIEMLFSLLSERWRKLLTRMSLIFTSVCVVFYFISIEALNNDQHVFHKQCSLQSDEILSTRDVRYVLYGEGEQDERSLHKHIRASTSRHTASEPRRLSRPHRRHYSQIGQSQYVDKLLQRRRNGVFLECGAYDGEELSNSLFFELHRNWTGILIEANPIRLQSLIRKNRNAFVVRGCLSVTTRPAIVKFTMHPYFAGEISGSVDETVNKSVNSYDRSSHNASFKTLSKSTGFPEIYVHCFPLMSIVNSLNIHHIDYISLDVEGAELAILNTIDWTRLTVDVFTIEYGAKLHKLNELRTFFKKTGHYKEAGFLPTGKHEATGQDVVFMRL